MGLQLDKAGALALVTAQPRVLTMRGDLLGLRIAGLKQLLAAAPHKLTQVRGEQAWGQCNQWGAWAYAWPACARAAADA